MQRDRIAPGDKEFVFHGVCGTPAPARMANDLAMNSLLIRKVSWVTSRMTTTDKYVHGKPDA